MWRDDQVTPCRESPDRSPSLPLPRVVTFTPPPKKKTTVWMTPGQPRKNCPPGLEVLAQVDQLLVSKLRENTQEAAAAASEQGVVKFKVKNSLGERMFFASKRPYPPGPAAARGPACAWQAALTDGAPREVLRVVRRFRCGCHCCGCNGDELEIQSPPGCIIGYLRQQMTNPVPSLSVTDAQGEARLCLRGPSCSVYCAANNSVSFQILSKDERSQVGTVTKQWMMSAEPSSAGNSKGGKIFIQFPMDLEPALKATLLASCFLVEGVITGGTRRIPNAAKGICASGVVTTVRNRTQVLLHSRTTCTQRARARPAAPRRPRPAPAARGRAAATEAGASPRWARLATTAGLLALIVVIGGVIGIVVAAVML